MSTPSVITIDGPAGAGKSTLGERLANRLGYIYFDTGVMYRALTLAALMHQIDPNNIVALSNLARSLDIQVHAPSPTIADGRQYTVLVDKEDVTWQLRRPDVEAHVSIVARDQKVRDIMRARQREIGKRGKVVMVGRDIGTIVMPHADLKIYLLASLDERAQRRMRELQIQGRSVDYPTIREEIARRDTLDQHVMFPAPDALTISTDGHTPDEIVDTILRMWRL